MPGQAAVSIERLKAQAAEKARVYAWAAAAGLYRQALESIDGDHDPTLAGQVSGLLAHAYYKAAFQSKTREEFKRKIQSAKTAYEQTATLYGKTGSDGLSKQSMARALFVDYSLAENPEARRKILKECIQLAEEAIQLLERERNWVGLAQACGEILAYFQHSFPMTPDWGYLKQQFEKVLEIGEKAAAIPEEQSDAEILLESLSNSGILIGIFWENILERSTAAKKTEELCAKIREISRKIGTPYASFWAHFIIPWIRLSFEKDYTAAIDSAERASAEVSQTRDSYLIGWSAAGVLGLSKRAERAEEDSQRRRAIIERALKFAPSAIENLAVSYLGWLLAWVYMQHADLLSDLAIFVETDSRRKMTVLRNAVGTAREGMVYKGHNPGTEASHALSRALLFLATLDVGRQEKMNLLKEALTLREGVLQETELATPGSFGRGMESSHLALVKFELSKIEQDPKAKLQLLLSAASDMQQCLDICSGTLETPIRMADLSMSEESYGDMLVELHSLSGEPEDARKAVKEYEGSIAFLAKLGFTGSIPAVRWKVAKALDSIGDYEQASKAFRKASTDYRTSAKKIPGSASAFDQLASYMDSWVEIEEARLHHDSERYLSAAEAYQKAAKTLRATNAWNHVGEHYEACSFLETGEALSRQEKPELALESFTQATTAFDGAKLQMESKLKEHEGSGEAAELAYWLSVTVDRMKYSHGRRELEEAKVLDKNGKDLDSARKYRSASEIFQALLAKAADSQSRGEMETLMLYSKAWTRMKEAETEASPEHYNEAAEFFMKAKESSVKKRFRLLAQANASICRALEAGARFRQTQNTQLYSDIKKQMQSAADHYQEAGDENAARWTRATQRLFDAIAYLANAETEIDSKKKTEFYQLAEKYLGLAAKLYGEAGFTTKKEEALKHLQRVREDKELLLTPVQALAENPALTGSPVAPVSLVRDKAWGLERFEAANVVGNLSVPQRVMNVGSELTLELELANVGKTAATLIKLENLVPEGLELDREKIPHRVEDNYIDMKGKRLEYLKTHEVKVPLRAARKGAFELRPRILFVDEKGNYRSYDFEPTALTISELGITGWLKGPK